MAEALVSHDKVFLVGEGSEVRDKSSAGMGAPHGEQHVQVGVPGWLVGGISSIDRCGCTVPSESARLRIAAMLPILDDSCRD
jgi:hypothetical protein